MSYLQVRLWQAHITQSRYFCNFTVKRFQTSPCLPAFLSVQVFRKVLAGVSCLANDSTSKLQIQSTRQKRVNQVVNCVQIESNNCCSLLETLFDYSGYGGHFLKKLRCYVGGEQKRMFGFPTELITKGKLAAVKRFEC